ncbi:Response regulator protein VraR [Streptomyces sp. Go-475]|nr:Response regulator protein VraR [Streptomyces sp. Go-475]
MQARAELSQAHQRQGAADERERMAREIHDTLARGYASIIVLAEAARAGLAFETARSAQQLRSIESTARENPAGPRAGRLAPVARTLRRVLDRFTEDTGLTVDADLADLECDQQTRTALLRCAQESLADVLEESAGFGLDGMRKRLAELDGIATTTEIVPRFPRTRVLILTTYDTDAEIERAVAAGAIGYLLKNTTRERLADAIRAAARGEAVPPPGSPNAWSPACASPRRSRSGPARRTSSTRSRTASPTPRSAAAWSSPRPR